MASFLFARAVAEAAPITGTVLDRPTAASARLVTYNVNWDSIFDRVNPTRAAGFARLAAAVDPDVWAFQEVGSSGTAAASTAAELKSLLDTLQPTRNGWHVWKNTSLAIASRWPLSRQVSDLAPTGDTIRPEIGALVDLPDEAFPTDLFVVNAHFRCCSGTTNDPRRQRDADAIVKWIAQALTPGSPVALPPGTAITVLGDFNIVGSPQPLDTLLTGDIQDNGTYGPDSPPDWDGTANAVLDARHNNVANGALWTWRNDAESFPPGRLDFITFTDSVITPAHAFVLNTAAMTEQELSATGLQPFDALLNGAVGNYDHLPVVMDFISVPEPGGSWLAGFSCVALAAVVREAGRYARRPQKCGSGISFRSRRGGVAGGFHGSRDLWPP